MKKTFTYLFIIALSLIGFTQHLSAQLTGTAVTPVPSTEANPIYYSIESAAVTSLGTPGTTVTSILPMKDKGYVLYSPAAAGKINYRIATATDVEKWAVVVIGGKNYLKNKSTGLFMRGSHSVGAYHVNDSLRMAKLGSGQYSLRTSVDQTTPTTANNSYTIAWNSLTCDRWGSATLNTNTAWFFVLDPASTNVPQTITFPAIANKTMGDAAFAPGASTTSALPITYTTSDAAIASIVDGKIQINGIGTCTICADQSGNANYTAATRVTQSLTVLSIADATINASIADAATQLTNTIVGTNPGQYLSTTRSTLQTAINAATAVKNNTASTDQNKIDAASVLDAAKTTYLASMNSIKFSTETTAVWYAIKTPGRTGTNYLKDCGIGSTIKGAAFTPSVALLWKIVDLGSGNVNIISKLNNGHITNTTTTSVAIPLTATPQTRTITSLGQAQYNINGGTNQLHLDGSFNLVGWNGGLGTGSAWMFEEVGLNELITSAEATYTANPAGTNPGQFTTADKATFRAAIDAAICLKANGSATAEQINAGMDALIAATDAFLASPKNSIKLSTTGNDTWYYIASAYPAPDSRNGQVMVDNAAGAGLVNFTAKEANNNKYWRFVAGTVTPSKVMIQNRASGLYFAATPVLSATAGEYVVSLLGQGQFSFNVTGSNPLHAQAAGSQVVTYTGGLNTASAWTLEEVVFTPQTITFPAIDTKTRNAAPFELAATTSASGLTVTYTSSNPNIATVAGSTVTITATEDGYTDIIASQAGNATYAAATPVTNRFYVSGVTSVNSKSSVVCVYAQDNMIVVTGSKAPVKAFTASGIEVDATKALKPGVYVVKVAEITAKLIIK